VDERSPPYIYDDEKIIFLSDNFSNTNEVIETGLKSNPFSFGGENAMVMINGKGGGVTNGSSCNASLFTIDVKA
jgi:L-ascorbate oxidase